jgi:hypothetical protein
MISKIEIRFDDDPQNKPLIWDFDFTLTRSVHLDASKRKEEEWTALGNEQCPSCSLDPAVDPQCPVAVILASYAKELFNRHSTDLVTVRAWSASGRLLVLPGIQLQEVTGELVRLAVFQSGCPIGRKMRRAVEFLPSFPDDKEIAKAFALHLALEDRKQKRSLFDFGRNTVVKDLDELTRLFECLSRRIRPITLGDAQVNGVLIYHSLAMMMAISLPEQIESALKEISEGGSKG